MKNLENQIRKYLVERGWHNMKPSGVAKSIVLEAAELLEIFQWSDESSDDLKANKEKFEQLRTEIADIMIYCLDLAVILDIDAEKAILQKLESVKKKYPVEAIMGKGNVNYLKIKKSYRRKKIS